MDSKTLTKITEYCRKEYAKSHESTHGWDHIQRVLKNAKQIIRYLHIEHEIDTNLIYASCLLHDILSTKYKSNFRNNIYYHIWEKILIRKKLPMVLRSFELHPEDFQTLMESIANHSYSIPYRRLNKKNDLYSKILQDADTLDFASYDREAAFIFKGGKLKRYITNAFLKRVRKNLTGYLNYPQLAEHFDHKAKKQSNHEFP